MAERERCGKHDRLQRARKTGCRLGDEIASARSRSPWLAGALEEHLSDNKSSQLDRRHFAEANCRAASTIPSPQRPPTGLGVDQDRQDETEWFEAEPRLARLSRRVRVALTISRPSALQPASGTNWGVRSRERRSRFRVHCGSSCQPDRLNWETSCPVKPWLVRRGSFTVGLRTSFVDAYLTNRSRVGAANCTVQSPELVGSSSMT